MEGSLEDLARRLREDSELRSGGLAGRAAAPGRPERELWAALGRGDAKAAAKIKAECVQRGGAHLCGLGSSAFDSFALERKGTSLAALRELEREGALGPGDAARLALEGILRDAIDWGWTEAERERDLRRERERREGGGASGRKSVFDLERGIQEEESRIRGIENEQTQRRLRESLAEASAAFGRMGMEGMADLASAARARSPKIWWGSKDEDELFRIVEEEAARLEGERLGSAAGAAPERRGTARRL